MAEYALYVDLTRCIGCYSCVVGCKNWNQLHNTKGSPVKILDFTLGSYPEIIRWMVPVFCGQCDKPPCAYVCKTKAIYKNEYGIVVIDQEKCLGTGKCEKACPFGVIVFDFDKKKVFKCDMCVDRIKSELDPFCVSVCPTEAIIFDKKDTILKQKAPCFSLDQEIGSNVFYSYDSELVQHLKDIKNEVYF